MKVNKPLNGRTALVSGGSRGIGAAVARELAAAGARVGVNFHRNRDAAEMVREACLDAGADACIYPADVRIRAEVKEMVLQVSRDLGEPSIIVHSAGVAGESMMFQDVTEAEYDRLFDTHVRGAYHLIQETLPSMVRRRFGRILLISSVWGEAGGAGEAVYSAAKGALNGMTRALAKELAPSGITVNGIAPGAIRTDMLNGQLTELERRELAERIPAGRLGEAGEVASLAAHLCREASAYLTGQVLHINGGWYP